MEINSSFLGTGWSFPPTFNQDTAMVEMVSDEEDIVQSLEIILSTRPAERIMQPDFGCELSQFLFEEITQGLITGIRGTISDALLYHEPRIDVEDINIEESEEEGLLLISIIYTVRATNSRFNLVYPFYINESQTGLSVISNLDECSSHLLADAQRKPTRKQKRKGKMANMGKQYVTSRPVPNMGQKKSQKEQRKFPQLGHNDTAPSATTDLSDYRQPQPGEMIANVMKSQSTSKSSSPPNYMVGKQLQAPRLNGQKAITNPPTQLKATSRTSLPMAGVEQPKKSVDRNKERTGLGLDSITIPKVQLKAQRVGSTHQQPTQLQQQADTATQSTLGGESASLGKGDRTETGKVSSEAQRPNKTGLPDSLKTGIENLSGYSMDDVRVHYNSEKPGQLQALAYTQGTDIHVAQGQEKHLPHEAWHVVQQKERRVQPTQQYRIITNINEDKWLEREADVMGRKAMEREENRKQRKKEGKYVKKEPVQTGPGIVQKMERESDVGVDGSRVLANNDTSSLKPLHRFVVKYKEIKGTKEGEAVQKYTLLVSATAFNVLNAKYSGATHDNIYWSSIAVAVAWALLYDMPQYVEAAMNWGQFLIQGVFADGLITSGNALIAWAGSVEASRKGTNAVDGALFLGLLLVGAGLFYKIIGYIYFSKRNRQSQILLPARDLGSTEPV